MSEKGQARQGGASCRSSHVRNAPLATVAPKRRHVVMGQTQTSHHERPSTRLLSCQGAATVTVSSIIFAWLPSWTRIAV